MQSTVRGVMSDDVVRFFNLLTTTQFWATMAYLSREYWKRRCWAITKSMENEIVVEAFMNFRTHTRLIICNGASCSSISDLPSCFHWDLNKALIIADKELEARE
ncbi:hypothetical protein YC2023_071488 [Brassica napus]